MTKNQALLRSVKSAPAKQEAITMSPDQLQEFVNQQVAQALAANAAAQRNRPLTMKVSANKGALSVYGLGRFPVTLYAEQWGRLLDNADAIRAFIEANKASLASKDQG